MQSANEARDVRNARWQARSECCGDQVNSKDSTILIVDDEPDLRDAIAFEFKRKGFNVLTAGNGREALAVLSKQTVQIVLSDVRMPDGDGIELLEKIKEKNVFLPVVMFITGFADITLEEAYNKGADAVFSKPFDRKALYEAVVRALQPMDERFKRKEIRVVSELPIKLRFLKSDVSVDSRVLNIGRGGMFSVLTNQFPELLEQVDFNLETAVPPVFKISGKGVVRWVRSTASENFPAGCGIELVNLDSECLTQVIELINFLKTKAFIPRK
jgi:CheY-like chemotaxis protein